MKDYSKLSDVKLWGELGKLDCMIDNLVDEMEDLQEEIARREAVTDNEK